MRKSMVWTRIPETRANPRFFRKRPIRAGSHMIKIFETQKPKILELVDPNRHENRITKVIRLPGIAPHGREANFEQSFIENGCNYQKLRPNYQK